MVHYLVNCYDSTNSMKTMMLRAILFSQTATVIVSHWLLRHCSVMSLLTMIESLLHYHFSAKVADALMISIKLHRIYLPFDWATNSMRLACDRLVLQLFQLNPYFCVLLIFLLFIFCCYARMNKERSKNEKFCASSASFFVLLLRCHVAVAVAVAAALVSWYIYFYDVLFRLSQLYCFEKFPSSNWFFSVALETRRNLSNKTSEILRWEISFHYSLNWIWRERKINLLATLNSCFIWPLH